MRRTKLLIITALIFIASLPTINAYAIACLNLASEEVRGLWITRDFLASKEKILEFINAAEKYNFNTLFVQVRGRGEAFYHSKIEPRSNLLQPGDFDPLAFVIKEAHPRNLKVHAWLNAYYVWSEKELPEASDHVVNKYPRWIIHSRGRKFLLPSHPEVNSYLYNVYMEIAQNYDVDGIHFDYIRYPTDFVGVESKNVTALVRDVYYGLKKLKPKLQVSAAVYPDIKEAISRKGQDWSAWLKEGIVDFVVPMVYTVNKNVREGQIVEAIKVVSGKHVLAGLGAYNLSLAELKSAIKFCRSLNSPALKGMVFFSYTTFKEKPTYLDALKLDQRPKTEDQRPNF